MSVVVGHGRPQARLEERQHLDRRADRGHRHDLRRSSRRCWCRTIPSPRTSSKRLLPPFWMDGTNPGYLLGTDQLGRDYLSRLI